MVNVDKDIKLQNALHKGNRSLDFSDVFREYQHPIYNYLLRMTQNKAVAEDLTQETFIRVHRSLPSFRGEAIIYLDLSHRYKYQPGLFQAQWEPFGCTGCLP